MPKIKNLRELKEIVKNLKKENKSIVTTNGVFDILHISHVHILQKAKDFGDILIVLLNSDASVKKNKGPLRPIIPEKERAEMLAALNCVDYVILFEEDKPLNILKELKPNIHAKGGTFLQERIKEEKELLESWGGEFKTFELEEGYSTTNIIEKIIKNNKK